MREQESNAVKITKIIQEFIAVEGKDNREHRQAGSHYINIFAPFYDVLAKKVESLKRIESQKDVLSDKSSIEIDKRGTVCKKVTMEHSTNYFAEIVAHIMMIMDINFLESEDLFRRIKNLFIELILNFSKIQLENLKDVILEEYFNDLIYSMVASYYAEQSHHAGLPPDCQV